VTITDNCDGHIFISDFSLTATRKSAQPGYSWIFAVTLILSCLSAQIWTKKRCCSPVHFTWSGSRAESLLRMEVLSRGRDVHVWIRRAECRLATCMLSRNPLTVGRWASGCGRTAALGTGLPCDPGYFGGYINEMYIREYRIVFINISYCEGCFHFRSA